MLAAMDRVMTAPSRRSRLFLGTIAALGLIAPGCSRLPWRKSKPEPPMLGRVTDTTDIYAMKGRPEASTVAVGSSPVPAGAVAGVVAEGEPGTIIEEVGVSARPAEPALVEPPAGGIALQAPTPMDARTATRPAKAADSVPNAALVLASAERTMPANSTSSSKATEVVAEARLVLDSMTNYEVALHRQERVNGTLLPEEDVMLAIRRQPRAVRLSWPTGTNQGREVLYRSDEPNAPMHVKLANPALPRMTISPESPMVMRNSRHPVTEAGFDSIVEALETKLKDPGSSSLTYVGLETAEGLDQPQDCLADTLPNGDRSRVYFDPKTHLPSLVLTINAGGELLERYLFREVRTNLPELATAEAFDANARWGPARGLLGRFARGEAANESSETPR